MRKGFLVAALMGLTAIAGCFGDDSDDGGSGPGQSSSLVPVSERYLQPFNVTGDFSYTLLPGPYAILDGVSVDVPVELPLEEGGNALSGDAHVNLGLFLPDVPAGTPIPVIVDAGPYYSASVGVPQAQTEGDTIATQPANRLGRFLIENFVPHGYAVAQLSVFGTGDSNHCMDLMGLSEQLGIDAAVTWLGTQDWSNGNVALIGRSYDGSTPWQAATFGNPHLATIVPISGLTGVHELMYHNGSAESRGAGLLYAIYAAMTVDGEPGDGQQALCRDYATGLPEGLVATTLGDPASGADEYWTERYFLDRVLANYDGSVYVIHGLQDWNVEPHMAFPAYNQLEDAGVEVKALLGQWGHMYPDRPSEHAGLGAGRGAEAYPYSVRYDWAQDLLEWFDHYLKGTGPKPSLHVEVQDNQGFWRVEPTWPPEETTLDMTLGSDLAMQGGVNQVQPGGDGFSLATEPLTEDLRIAGLPHLELIVESMGTGGQIYARLSDDQGMHLGHAIMDLRYRSGEKTAEPMTPALPTPVRLEFEPMDVLVPAGRSLVLAFSDTGEDYLPTSNPATVTVQLNDQTFLHLPTVDPAPSVFFTPPVWEGVADVGEPQP